MAYGFNDDRSKAELGLEKTTSPFSKTFSSMSIAPESTITLSIGTFDIPEGYTFVGLSSLLHSSDNESVVFMGYRINEIDDHLEMTVNFRNFSNSSLSGVTLGITGTFVFAKI